MSLYQSLVSKHTLKLTDYRCCTRLRRLDSKYRCNISLEANPSINSSSRYVVDRSNTVADPIPSQSVNLIVVLSLDQCVSLLTVAAVRDLNELIAVVVVPLEADSCETLQVIGRIKLLLLH